MALSDVRQALATMWCILEAVRVRAIRKFGVVAEEPDDQHFFHAHIMGFPVDKSELMEAADDLAEAAGPVVLPEG